MPTFFDPSQLSPEQSARWPQAAEAYEVVMQSLDGSGQRTAVPQPGHPKSALFARLLNGKKPLRYPPPTSYSYPWYAALEAPRCEIVDFGQAQKVHDFMTGLRFLRMFNGACLHQDANWRPLVVVSPDEAILTYPEWQRLGVRWRLVRERVHSRDAARFLVCHHDPKAARITNMDQLRAEVRWMCARQQIPNETVQDRELRFEAMLGNYLGTDYEADASGELWARVWALYPRVPDGVDLYMV